MFPFRQLRGHLERCEKSFFKEVVESFLHFDHQIKNECTEAEGTYNLKSSMFCIFNAAAIRFQCIS